MPARPAKPLRQQLAESGAMISARDAAAQTPEEVRKAFLSRGRTVGPVNVQAFSLGILWLFEELKHPFNNPVPIVDGEGKAVLDARGKPTFAPLSMRDTARAIFIFHDAQAAGDALAEDETVLDAQARELACGIDPAELPAIIAVITQTLTEGLATIPGAGASNPPETGS